MRNYGQWTQSDIKISLSICQGKLFGTQFHPLISGNHHKSFNICKVHQNIQFYSPPIS